MTQNTQPAAANSNRAFNMLGTVSNISTRTDRNGADYTVFTFATTLRGKSTSRMAVAFGKAHEAIQGMADGEQRIYARINGGVFAVIGFGNPLKSEQVAA